MALHIIDLSLTWHIIRILLIHTPFSEYLLVCIPQIHQLCGQSLKSCCLCCCIHAVFAFLRSVGTLDFGASGFCHSRIFTWESDCRKYVRLYIQRVLGMNGLTTLSSSQESVRQTVTYIVQEVKSKTTNYPTHLQYARVPLAQIGNSEASIMATIWLFTFQRIRADSARFCLEDCCLPLSTSVALQINPARYNKIRDDYGFRRTRRAGI